MENDKIQEIEEFSIETPLHPIEKMRNVKIQNDSILDVVSQMINDKNIELKTEITNPYAIATFDIFIKYFKNRNQELVGTILESWKTGLFKYMISNERKSRKEMVDILKGLVEYQKENDVNLLSNLVEKK